MTDRAALPAGYPLLKLAIEQLSPRKPLAKCRASVSVSAQDELPALAEVLGALGCPTVEVLAGKAPSRILLHTPSGTRQLRLELRRRGGEDAALSTADFPAVAYLLERWYLDFRVWDVLLPRAARGSLPGRLLTVKGYRRRGRSIAWRARQLGLRVQIEEDDPRRMLDALFDGFASCAPPVATPDLMVDTMTDGDMFAAPDGVPRGLADELSALAGFVVTAFADAVRFGEDRPIIEACDPLLLNLILRHRMMS